MGLMGDYGFSLQSGANVFSTGLPKTLNRVCFYGNVQEISTNSWQCRLSSGKQRH